MRRLPPRLLLDWKAYSELEPFGTEADNYLAAGIARIVAQAGGLKKANRQELTIDDLLLRFGVPVEELKTKTRVQSWQEKKAFAYVIAAAFNAKGKDI